MASGVVQGGPVAVRSPAAAASRRTMARFMRWSAVKLSSGVSRVIVVGFGAGEEALRFRRGRSCRPRGRGAGWR